MAAGQVVISLKFEKYQRNEKRIEAPEQHQRHSCFKDSIQIMIYGESRQGKTICAIMCDYKKEYKCQNVNIEWNQKSAYICLCLSLHMPKCRIFHVCISNNIIVDKYFFALVQ